MEDFAQAARQIAAQIAPELIELRHRLHTIPETGEAVPQTHDAILAELRAIDGLSIKEHASTGYGIIATLTGNAAGSKCVLLRADIDALPILEVNDLPFKSTHEGAMHACGHDGHATWMVGAARILSQLRDLWGGTIKFVWQPGEEVGKCALEFIEQDGVLENPKVDAAFAGHGWPSIEAGKIGIARRCAFGCVGVFSVRIVGKKGHASWPELAINPLDVVSAINCETKALLDSPRYRDERKVLTFTSITGGDPQVRNIIPEACSFGGTMRCARREIAQSLAADFESLINDVCARFGATAECDIEVHLGNVENDASLLPITLAASQAVVGEENAYIIEEDNLGGENFSAFSQRVPSVYLFMGIGRANGEETPGLHSPDFRFDDAVLANAAAVFAIEAQKTLAE